MYLHEEIDKSTIIAGDFRAYLSETDRYSRVKNIEN